MRLEYDKNIKYNLKYKCTIKLVISKVHFVTFMICTIKYNHLKLVNIKFS